MRNIAVFSALICLSACEIGSYPSYVGPLDPQLAPQVAADMAAFVTTRIKPADGSIQIEQPSADQSVGPILTDDLRASGFTVVPAGGKHRIRYAASAFNGDIMTRISIDHADAARLYGNKPGAGLAPLGPFSVTELAQ
jgi:hypothetical protein